MRIDVAPDVQVVVVRRDLFECYGARESRYLESVLEGVTIFSMCSGLIRFCVRPDSTSFSADEQHVDEQHLVIAPTGYTVRDAVTDWLAYRLNGRDAGTVTTITILCKTRVIPALGARKLRDLSADDVDRWLAEKSKVLSTRSLEAIRSCLNRAVKRAMARDKAKRNVVELCSVPAGHPGRPSKSLTLKQAEAVLTAAEDSPIYAYLVVSLLTGGRTEDMRPLTWGHVDLDEDPAAMPAIPPHIAVWCSVRSTGDTKTWKSRRTLALPGRAIDALKIQRERQGWQRLAAGDQWQETGLVFTSAVGTELDAANVRREFRKVLAGAAKLPGMDVEPHVIEPDEWTTRETRTSFVSILSDGGHPARGDLPPGRSLQHRRHGGGLPEADSPGDPDRGSRHGHDFRA